MEAAPLPPESATTNRPATAPSCWNYPATAMPTPRPSREKPRNHNEPRTYRKASFYPDPIPNYPKGAFYRFLTCPTHYGKKINGKSIEYHTPKARLQQKKGRATRTKDRFSVHHRPPPQPSQPRSSTAPRKKEKEPKRKSDC